MRSIRRALNVLKIPVLLAASLYQLALTVAIFGVIAAVNVLDAILSSALRVLTFPIALVANKIHPDSFVIPRAPLANALNSLMAKVTNLMPIPRFLGISLAVKNSLAIRTAILGFVAESIDSFTGKIAKLFTRNVNQVSLQPLVPDGVDEETLISSRSPSPNNYDSDTTSASASSAWRNMPTTSYDSDDESASPFPFSKFMPSYATFARRNEIPALAPRRSLSEVDLSGRNGLSNLGAMLDMEQHLNEVDSIQRRRSIEI